MLVRDDEPALWWLVQDYTGPDGVPRRREGLVGALRRRALRGGRRAPARAHARRAEGGPPAPAARDAHAGRAALLPLRGLAERAGRRAGDSTSSSTASAAVSGACRATPPAELADATPADRRRPPPLRDRACLPRGGRHRGERIDPGGDRPDRAGRADDLPHAPDRPDDERAPAARPGAERRRLGRARSTRGPGRASSTARRTSSTRSSSPATPARFATRRDADEARAAVDAGEAEAAFLLRPPTVEQVAAVARGRRVMPQKSTFFYPKLTSGLLFMPLDLTGSRPAALAVEDVRGVLAELPRALRPGAGPRQRDGRRRHDRDRRRRRGGRRRAVRRAPAATSRSSPRSSASAAAALDLGRARPDRRLDQRQAGPAVLLALGRDRRGRDDGRRRLRLRLRLRHGRGVDGRARRRRAPERRAARAASRRRTRSSSSRSRRPAPTSSPSTRRRSSGSRTGCGSSARWRSRSATSPTAASTRSAR